MPTVQKIIDEGWDVAKHFMSEFTANTAVHALFAEGKGAEAVVGAAQKKLEEGDVRAAQRIMTMQDDKLGMTAEGALFLRDLGQVRKQLERLHEDLDGPAGVARLNDTIFFLASTDEAVTRMRKKYLKRHFRIADENHRSDEIAALLLCEDDTERLALLASTGCADLTMSERILDAVREFGETAVRDANVVREARIAAKLDRLRNRPTLAQLFHLQPETLLPGQRLSAPTAPLWFRILYWGVVLGIGFGSIIVLIIRALIQGS